MAYTRLGQDQRKLPLFTFSCLLLCASSALAQARVNPDLPAGSQPLVKTRVLLILPDYESVDPSTSPQGVAPLSVKQKFQIFTGQTFDLTFPFTAAALAGVEQAGDTSPNYGQGGAAYAQRFGAEAAGLSMNSFFSNAAFPSLFHQDPRYFRKGTGSKKSRIWHAISQVAVAQSDAGKSTFNYSLVGGIATTIAISNSYYPDRNRTAGNSAARFGISLGVVAGLNILREFRPASRKRVKVDH